MDEYINNLCSSSSWGDGCTKEKSCWSYNETDQFNVMPPTLLRLHENDKGDLPSECIPAQDVSALALDGELNHAVDRGLISREAQTENGIQYRIDQVSPLMDCGLKKENVGMQYGTALSTGPALHSMNLNYSKQLPVVDALSSCLSFTEASHVGCNSSGKFHHNRSFKDLQELASLLQFYPSASYGDASSMSAVIGQEATQIFDHQEVNIEDDMHFMRKKLSMEQILQLDKMSKPVVSKDKENLPSYPVSSFTTGSNSNITMAMNAVSFPSQTTSAAPAGSCNGTSKPRVRARRGQATDPHSIAERLRREKIAERMKNLQELVPNSCKVDKASMLDEIIEYVKFLQLQVKVLSMSRLGAAGAVIPLITDDQTEGSNNLSLSPSAGWEIDIVPSADQIAFEQEVLKLMESNMTAAVQYLQSKGLCLMPMALATAISSGKASISSGDSSEKKVSLEHDCNGILKLDDAKNTFGRELKPKTKLVLPAQNEFLNQY